jgi:4-carboxymuconolactone decarboxylase
MATEGSRGQGQTDRAASSEATYRELFGPRDPNLAEDDPEFMAILRKVIFGDVFHIGTLDHRTRELITVAVLTTTQMLPQLRAHAAAALNVGVTPTELREAIYQCAPFIGFPATLNAIGILNNEFRSRNIELPLPDQATTDDHERFEAGKAIQSPIYGEEISDSLADLPEDLRVAIPTLLTEFCFGDFYTRTGLDLPERELIVLCVLAALGGTDEQVRAHAAGNLKVGNDTAKQLTALIHALPYIGFPRALNAIRALNNGTSRPDEAPSS